MLKTIPLEQFEQEGKNPMNEVNEIKEAYKKVIDIATSQITPDDITKVFNYIMKEYPLVFIKAYETVCNPMVTLENGCDLYLDTVGQRKIELIKEIRYITSFGLQQAKDLVEGSLPVLVISGLTKMAAEEDLGRIQDVGATGYIVSNIKSC